MASLFSVCFQVQSAETSEDSSQTLTRKKREWILPPLKLMENTDYTHKQFIAKVSWLSILEIFPGQ